MDSERPPNLRTVGSPGEQAADTGAPPLASGMAINAMAELVVDLLAATGLVAPDKLALVRGRAGQGSLAQAIVDEGVAPPEGIARSLAVRYQIALVDLALAGVDEGGGRADPAARAGARRRDPVRARERHAAHRGRRPGQPARDRRAPARDPLSARSRRLLERGHPRRAAPDGARLRGVRHPRGAGGGRRRPRHRRGATTNDDLEADDGISDAPLVRLVNSVIFQAAEDGASDVHFEPQEDALVVRFRVDGVLQEVQRIPKRMTPGVTTRLKVLAKLDIAERRKPQDGRISLNAAAAGRMLDIRVATLPTVEGEKVVMRLLDKSRRAPTLEELGLSDDMRDRLAEIIAKPTGALLVTGPTGSGKSTTLYAGLTTMNRPEINIITVEDPVEYRLSGRQPGADQRPRRAHVRLGAALDPAFRPGRGDGRRDPGRRDRQDLDRGRPHRSLRALDAAHQRRPERDHPLNEMGVEPFLTGAAVTGVLAQRLARKLCSHCCEMYQPSIEELLQSRVAPDVAAASDGMVFYRKKGCPRCNQTGYKGRVGVYQLLTMTESIAQLAVARASREDVERAAMDAGMRSLWDDGLAKVAAGLTSVEELARVLV